MDLKNRRKLQNRLNQRVSRKYGEYRIKGLALTDLRTGERRKQKAPIGISQSNSLHWKFYEAPKKGMESIHSGNMTRRSSIEFATGIQNSQKSKNSTASQYPNPRSCPPIQQYFQCTTLRAQYLHPQILLNNPSWFSTIPAFQDTKLPLPVIHQAVVYSEYWPLALFEVIP